MYEPPKRGPHLGPPVRCPFFYRFFLAGRVPYYDRLQKKGYTLILASLLEDLGSSWGLLEPDVRDPSGEKSLSTWSKGSVNLRG